MRDVTPGAILTDSIQELVTAIASAHGWTGDWADLERSAAADWVPNDVGRFGRPEEIAAAVAYLAGTTAAYASGATIRVDGGRFPPHFDPSADSPTSGSQATCGGYSDSLQVPPQVRPRGSKASTRKPKESEMATDPNADVIEEFRAHQGAVAQAMGGALKGLDLVLLHHIGRKSKKEYVTPVSHMTHNGSYLLLGSFAGAPTEPHWVGNLESMDRLTVEFGNRTEEVRATVFREGPEWERLYETARAHWPFIRDYEKKTSRTFPVVRLERVSAIG
ncbi:nitroreductase/quinone reductase family protein [Streptomyces sp. NPDC057137]|uniref:nitroreductase/quinone reductase family protein n=1 Tax=Streptomyces sp. NPDC057137 TaxID=3346030 RepID=UPI00362899F9